MIIEVGTPRYKELFGFRDFLNQPFESRLPPHKLLVEALGDPSKSIAAIDEIIGDANPNGILHAAGLQDLQLGAQVLMHARVAASRFGGKLTLDGNGTLSSLTEGLVDVMKSIKIPARASAEDVQIFLADTAFAIGMKALGAIGPVGKIAAAILGFARGIIQIVKQRRELATMDAERREALAYAKLPPLQEPDVQVDAWYVDAVLKAKMETGSWSHRPEVPADSRDVHLESTTPYVRVSRSTREQRGGDQGAQGPAITVGTARADAGGGIAGAAGRGAREAR